MLYKLFIRPVLFLFSPETSHHLVVFLLKMASCIPGKNYMIREMYSVKNKKLERNICGLRFSNPVGLAAGFDKDAKFFDEMSNFGFGFIEVGTVTPKPQSGNDKPRLFRLSKDKALINRMGFNNEGADAMAKRLGKRKKSDVIIGGNIGKNKTTPNENAISDYEYCFEKLYDCVDYFVVNVSSPNTPGLRELQEKKPLTDLLKRLMFLNAQKKNPKPIFLKIAPDLTNSQLDDIIEIVRETKIAGIVATNTTLSRNYLKTPVDLLNRIGAGGLSGKPLMKRSMEIIKYIHEKSGGSIPVIASGGIHSAKDAMDKLKAGASLVQLYTGFIYEGPGLVKKINRAFLKWTK